jgi:hypothetical protein
MRWDYVLELWSPLGLLFISQIYECRKPQWNDFDRKAEELGEKPVPVPPLCPPHPTWIDLGMNLMSHGTVLSVLATTLSKLKGWNLKFESVYDMAVSKRIVLLHLLTPSSIFPE